MPARAHQLDAPEAAHAECGNDLELAQLHVVVLAWDLLLRRRCVRQGQQTSLSKHGDYDTLHLSK